MFMPKKALSVTLDEANLLWLRGRAAGRKNRSLSDALDDILTTARRGGHGADAPRSVAGTIDIAGDDPGLERADQMLRDVFDTSIHRPFVARERVSSSRARAAAARKTRRG
jgi:hypothetical protein